MKSVTGVELTPAEQSLVLRQYPHRYTAVRRPAWAAAGKYPVQFKDDADWLANTRFQVTPAGRLDRRAKSCHSTPTWPNNPELRKFSFGEHGGLHESKKL